MAKNIKWTNANKWLGRIGFILDVLLYPFFWLRKTKNIPVKNILVFESHLIGDNIMTTALINALKHKYNNDCNIYTLTNSYGCEIIPDELVTQKFSTKVPWSTYDYSFKNLISFFKLIFKLRNYKFDLAIEPRGEWRNALVLLLLGAKNRCAPMFNGGASVINVPVKFNEKQVNLWDIRKEIARVLCDSEDYFIPKLNIKQSDFEFVEKFLTDRDINKFVVFNPSARQQWRSVEQNFIEPIVKNFLELGYSCVIPADPNLAHELKYLEKNKNCYVFSDSLLRAFGLIKYASMCISVDTSLIHVCKVYGTPLFLICAHVNPELIIPPGIKAHVYLYSKNEDEILQLNKKIISFLDHTDGSRLASG